MDQLTEDQRRDIRSRGHRDYFKLAGELRNPFPPGSAAYNEYERGWIQALKADEGRQIRPPSREPFGPQPPKPTPASDYNAYAEMKGRSTPRR